MEETGNVLVERLRRLGAIGQSHAVKRETLAGWLSVTVREVKAMAEEARLAGIPVGYSTDSTSGGLFLCERREEIRDCMGKLRRLALKLLREYSALKRSLSIERREQMELFS